MRYIVLCLVVSFAIILSCNTSSSDKLLNTENLPLQEYTIDINRDTVLVTKNGALLKIPKGSLVSGNDKTVTLEIKEAYSLEQMITGGLVTQSDGEPLSSGGMIYINAKGGQEVKITQPIKVALPANHLEAGMQLFKGEKDENGNINWKEPAALPENKQLQTVQQGEVLFQSKCGSCHAIGKDLSGPDLAHFPKRIPYDEGTSKYWYHYFRYVYTPYSIDEKGKVDSSYNERWTDPYACNLINRYGGIAVGRQTDDWHELTAIYRYIQNESDKRNLPLPAHAYLFDCTDSCSEYKRVIENLNYQKIEARLKKEKLTKGNGALVEEKREPVSPVIDEPVDTTPPPPINFEEKVSPGNYDAEYYQFTIESFGWFNIDILLKNINGVEESELFVRITGEYREKINVFLIIPSVKVNVEGGPAERNKEEFAFYLKNGKIPLPQNAKAYILAVTETEGAVAFGLKEFTTSLKQEFDISLSLSTNGAFNAAISKLGFDGLNIKVADAKNADEIRKTDKEIKDIDAEIKKAENMKPKGCDCNCGPQVTRTVGAPVEINSADIDLIIDP